jgi:hypothetical protein
MNNPEPSTAAIGITTNTNEAPTCKLIITPNLEVWSYRRFPSRWRRFWYWVFLGWTWRRF